MIEGKLMVSAFIVGLVAGLYLGITVCEDKHKDRINAISTECDKRIKECKDENK